MQTSARRSRSASPVRWLPWIAQLLRDAGWTRLTHSDPLPGMPGHWPTQVRQAVGTTDLWYVVSNAGAWGQTGFDTPEEALAFARRVRIAPDGREVRRNQPEGPQGEAGWERWGSTVRREHGDLPPGEPSELGLQLTQAWSERVGRAVALRLGALVTEEIEVLRRIDALRDDPHADPEALDDAEQRAAELAAELEGLYHEYEFGVEKIIDLDASLDEKLAAIIADQRSRRSMRDPKYVPDAIRETILGTLRGEPGVTVSEASVGAIPDAQLLALAEEAFAERQARLERLRELRARHRAERRHPRAEVAKAKRWAKEAKRRKRGRRRNPSWLQTSASTPPRSQGNPKRREFSGEFEDPGAPAYFRFISGTWDVRRARQLAEATFHDQVTVNPSLWMRQLGGFINIDPKRVAAIDLEKSPPILIAGMPDSVQGHRDWAKAYREDDWTHMVIDGWHRMAKAAELGIPFLPAIMLTPEESYEIRVDPFRDGPLHGDEDDDGEEPDDWTEDLPLGPHDDDQGDPEWWGSNGHGGNGHGRHWGGPRFNPRRPEDVPALSFPCPTCKAPMFKPCVVRATGKPLPLLQFHARRGERLRRLASLRYDMEARPEVESPLPSHLHPGRRLPPLVTKGGALKPKSQRKKYYRRKRNPIPESETSGFRPGELEVIYRDAMASASRYADDAFSTQVYADPAALERVIGAERLARFLKWTPGGVPAMWNRDWPRVGYLEAQRMGDEGPDYWVFVAAVPLQVRGLGLGIYLYSAAADEAERRGGVLHSAHVERSEMADDVWASRRLRRHYDVGDGWFPDRDPDRDVPDFDTLRPRRNPDDEITDEDVRLATWGLHLLATQKLSVAKVRSEQGGLIRVVVATNPAFYSAFVSRRQKKAQPTRAKPQTPGYRARVVAALQRIVDRRPYPREDWIGWELLELLREQEHDELRAAGIDPDAMPPAADEDAPF